MKTTNKILSSLTITMLALALTGCASINNTTSVNKKPEHTTSSKIVKSPSNKKDALSASQESNTSVTSKSTNKNVTASVSTSYASSSSASQQQVSQTQPTSNNGQSAVSNKINDDSTQKVLNSFMTANNLTPQKGNDYIVNKIGSNEYQIEVRTTGSDDTVSHLNNLYHYNTQSNQTKQFDSVSGQWK